MAQDYTILDGIVSDSPGASIDDDFFTELKANLEDLDTNIGTNTSAISDLETDLGTAEGEIDNLQVLVAIGTDSFGGTSGTVVAVDDRGSTDYHVSITPTESPGGNLGEVWVVVDSATQFTVYNSGTATTSFMWAAIGPDAVAGGGGGK